MDETREFENTTQGWLSAVKRNDEGKLRNVMVEPGGSVFLTQEEEVATANAPAKASNNPFLPQAFKVHDEQTGDVLEEGVRPQLRLVEEARATVARPTGPAVGSFAHGEEVGTP